MSNFSAGRRSSQDIKRKITSVDRRNELERAREANRIHCKETRDRKRERERLLREVCLRTAAAAAAAVLAGVVEADTN